MDDERVQLSKTYQRHRKARLKGASAPKQRKTKVRTARRKVDPAVVRERMRKVRENIKVSVNLTLNHSINGVSYGPGTVQVPSILAQELKYREERARDVEAKLQGTRGMIIGARGRTGQISVRQVPVETFQSQLESADAFDSISGK